jgi:hypothetical protein
MDLDMAAHGAWRKSDVRRMGGRDGDEGACEGRFSEVVDTSVAATGPQPALTGLAAQLQVRLATLGVGFRGR